MKYVLFFIHMFIKIKHLPKFPLKEKVQSKLIYQIYQLV